MMIDTIADSVTVKAMSNFYVVCGKGGRMFEVSVLEGVDVEEVIQRTGCSL